MVHARNDDDGIDGCLWLLVEGSRLPFTVAGEIIQLLRIFVD